MRAVDSPTYTGSAPTYVLRAEDDPVFKSPAGAREAQDPMSLTAFLRQSRPRAAHFAGSLLTSHGAVAAAAPLEELAEVYSVPAARPGSSDSAGVVLAGLAAVAAFAIGVAAGRRRRGYVSLSGTSAPYGSC